VAPFLFGHSVVYRYLSVATGSPVKLPVNFVM